RGRERAGRGDPGAARSHVLDAGGGGRGDVCAVRAALARVGSQQERARPHRLGRADHARLGRDHDPRPGGLLMMRALVLLLAGCGAATSDPGLRAELRVDGAQFATGALAGGAGPPVVALHLSDPSLFPGAQHQPFLGELSPSATSVAIGLDGDRGYWIVLAGTPSIDAPTEPTFA